MGGRKKVIQVKSGFHGKLQINRTNRVLYFNPMDSFEELEIDDIKEIALFQRNKVKAIRWWKEGVLSHVTNSELRKTNLVWKIPNNVVEKEVYVKVTLKERSRIYTINGVPSLSSKVTVPKEALWHPYFHVHPIAYGKNMIII